MPTGAEKDALLAGLAGGLEKMTGMLGLGASVRLAGLSDARLNGVRGTVDGPHAGDRVPVRCDDGVTRGVRVRNLLPEK